MPEASPLAATITTLSTDQAPILNRSCLVEAPPLVVLAACADEVGRLTSLLQLCTGLETAGDVDEDGLV